MIHKHLDIAVSGCYFFISYKGKKSPPQIDKKGTVMLTYQGARASDAPTRTRTRENRGEK